MIKKTVGLILSLGLILGAWQERVALYQQNAPDPIEVYPYRLEVLPPEDQLALERGIPIATWEQLQQLLQDYLS